MIAQLPVHRFLLAFSEKNIWECSSEWDDDFQTIAESALSRLEFVMLNADRSGIIFFAWIMFPDNTTVLEDFVKTILVRQLKDLVGVQNSRQRDEIIRCDDAKIEADGQGLVLFSSFTLSVMRGSARGPNAL